MEFHSTLRITAESLEHYITARKRIDGIDTEGIHAVAAGDGSEVPLRLSDIEAVCTRLAAAEKELEEVRGWNHRGTLVVESQKDRIMALERKVAIAASSATMALAGFYRGDTDTGLAILKTLASPSTEDEIMPCRPLPPGSIIKFEGVEAVVGLDTGGETLTVVVEGYVQEWFWEFEGKTCEIIKAPRPHPQK